MDNAEQNDPAPDEQNDPAVDEQNDPAVTDRNTILPSDDSKKEPMDDDGALAVGAEEKKHDEPDEEPANAADKESSGEEKDHPKSPHEHEVEGHDDVETEDANDRAVLELPGGDDDADVDSDVDQEAMQCDDAEPHHSDSDEVPASGGDLNPSVDGQQCDGCCLLKLRRRPNEDNSVWPVSSRQSKLSRQADAALLSKLPSRAVTRPLNHLLPLEDEIDK
jgi:hypothetical protein